jgi:hypothetical protein
MVVGGDWIFVSEGSKRGRGLTYSALESAFGDLVAG